jgi:hypothetical protein
MQSTRNDFTESAFLKEKRSIKMSVNVQRTTIQQQILTLLDRLPIEHVVLIEQFARFLYEQFQQKSYFGWDEIDSTKSDVTPTTTNMTYPLITVPADSLGVWINLSPKGYEGNALDDTEALYNEV